MPEIQYRTDDRALDPAAFIAMANQVWPGKYHAQYTKEALARTVNITARDGEILVGCVRVLTDGYFFSTVTEILVLPEYRGQGIGRVLMELALEASPSSLIFGAQLEAEGFYEKIGYDRLMQSFGKRKPRRQ